MKSALRSLLTLIAVVLLCGLWLGPARAQGTDPKYDPIFAKAQQMETTAKTNDVMAAFANIKKDYSAAGKDQNVAAESLLRAAEYAAGDHYGQVEEQNLRKQINVEDPAQVPAQVKELRTQMRSDGDYKAHEAIKQLLKEYPESAAATYAEQQHLQQTLENRIDQRNSSSMSYKIVDALVGLTGRIPAFSYWFALALIAVLVKAITFPLTLKMYRSQREMQRMQPILKEIQEKYKGKPELNQKVMDAYKEHGVSPFASCLPMLIQLPFMIWVYNMIRQYEFHFAHGKFLWIGSGLSAKFPGFLAGNLAQFDVVLLLIYAVSNYLTMKLTPPADPQQAQQQKSMSVMMTGMMLYMFWIYRWSAAFMFYWLVLNLISAWQQYTYIYKKRSPLGGAISGGTGGTGGGGSVVLNGGSEPKGLKPAPVTGANGNGNGARPESRPATPIPGGDAMRARPRRKRR